MTTINPGEAKDAEAEPRPPELAITQCFRVSFRPWCPVACPRHISFYQVFPEAPEVSKVPVVHCQLQDPQTWVVGAAQSQEKGLWH